MKRLRYEKNCWLVFAFLLSGMICACSSAPPALLPTSAHIQGLAVIPRTESGKKSLGHQKPLIVQDEQQRTILFSILEMNKTDASTTSIDTDSFDYVIKWKLRDQGKLDRSKLYLRLSSPQLFIYESDLGSSTRKFAIKTDSADAKKIWDIIGVTPEGL